jgi:hypothetical protein
MVRGITITMVLGLLGLPQVCFAAVSLSVNPIDGSNSLRFENTAPTGEEKNQEIHIRVTSTNGGQFQVFQRILEPLMNEKGEAFNLQAIATQTLPNSNSSGTLYLQNADHLTMSDQLLYSSSAGGTSDSFIIGYSLNQGLINTGGSFRGRLIFTVRGQGASDQVTIDVFLETAPSLKVAVKGARNPSQVTVQGSDITEKTADSVMISFSGNGSQEIRIYQEVEDVPQNQETQELGPDVLQLDTEGETEGLRVPGLSSLGNNKTLIYASSKDADSFVIYFLVDTQQLQQQAAGLYVGKIKYSVETGQGTQEFPINLQCTVPPIFTMNVTTPPGGVSFSHVLATNPPQEEEVMVTVLSNLNKPYQVFQNVPTNMVNEQGKEFNNQFFTIQVQLPSGQRGQTDFTEFTPVQTGEYPVFSSDAEGDTATFKVVYRLQGYAQMSPGNFLAPITFSLNQK